MDPKPAKDSDNKPPESDNHSVDYAPYPKLDPKDAAAPQPPPPDQDHWDTIAVGPQTPDPPPPTPPWTPPQPPPPPQKSVHWSSDLASVAPPAESDEPQARTMLRESNPYVSPAPVSSSASSSSPKNKMEAVRGVLGQWGKKVGEATKKAEDLAGNVWQHLKTAPSVADAAMGRIAQGSKVIAEGGYEKIFRQTFETVPEEQLCKSYACYLSTSAGPVMGVLYLSTARLAFCSDNPLSYTVGDQTEWSYYKVVIPMHQLKSVDPSVSTINSAEKYIQVVSVDDHEFWFLGFVHYDSAVKNLQEALQNGAAQST